ncbi:MAG: alpha/beta fold hydrolase [Phycisphaerae bacterium]|nr:alpha/beta fold hydrolase [Phycisphaerae bacterium]
MKWILMRRNIFLASLLLLGFVTGCGLSTEHMLKSGRIDDHRRVDVGDGVEIDCWIIQPRGKAKASAGETAPTVILLHPMLMDKSWFLGLGEKLAKKGWTVVLPDLRHHGKSGGAHITWGAKEKSDIWKLVNLLIREKQITPDIYVMGASLGGCVAVQYAAVDPRCKGVLALVPPTGVRGVVRRKWPLGTRPFIKSEIQRECRQGGYRSPDDADAVLAAKKLRCPIILVSAKLDMTVPASQVEEIYKAAPQPKKLISIMANHTTVQKWRDDWIIQQLEKLRTMGKPAATEPKPKIKTKTPPAGSSPKKNRKTP